MHLTCYQTTHIGARQSNQDSFDFDARDNWGCFVVADGLGGHYRGEIASQFVTQSLIKLAPKFASAIETEPMLGMKDFVSQAISKAQKDIIKKYQEVDTQTTIAVAWLNQDHFIAAHVGDSRIYKLNKQAVIWRTPDHTQVQALFEQGKITEEVFSTHPLQNQLLRSICTYEPPEVDIVVQPPLASNESLVLCTDGFWSGCEPEDFIKLSRNHGSTEKKVSDLIDRILKQQGEDCDNITVQVVKSLPTL